MVAPGALPALAAALAGEQVVYGDFGLIDSKGQLLKRYRSSPLSSSRLLKRRYGAYRQPPLSPGMLPFERIRRLGFEVVGMED